MIKKSIYVHIPFCAKKCNYCNFCSDKYSEDVIKKYFKKLHKEIACYKNTDCTISSVYFGGGTPSYVHESYITQTLSVLKQNFNVDINAEISIEINPNFAKECKLIAYKNAGINRLSFGVQTLCNDKLKILGRVHTKKHALDAITLAKKLGFENINADLMIAIPHQTTKQLTQDIQTLASLVTHFSCYMLICEKGTVLTKMIESNKFSVPSDDESIQMYESAYAVLKSLGFERYEISNFAKSGCECKHNNDIWQNGEFYGFGLAAHGFLNNEITVNTTDMNTYLTSDDFKSIESLNSDDLINQYIMLSLRTKQGCNLSVLKSLGYDIQKNENLTTLIEKNIVIIKNGYMQICENYFGVCSNIILKLIK